MSTAYTNHSPISITSDFDFLMYGFPGNGSASNPYQISSYLINTTDNCIEIANTTVYFIIQDCLLTSVFYRGTGIYLTNVTNGVVKNTTITYKYWPIRLVESQYNKLVDNFIVDNDDSLSISSSFYNEIVNNTFSGCKQWICTRVSSSSHNTFVNNTFADESKAGLAFMRAPDNVFISNTFINSGIYFLSNDTETWRQTITPDNLLNGKPILFLWNLTGEEIDGGNSGCVILANCTGVTLENCSINSAVVGIMLGHSTDCTLRNNTIDGSTNSGVKLWYSNGNTVTNNAILHSTFAGVEIEDSLGNAILNNTIEENAYGLMTSIWSSDNYIEDNVFLNNGHRSVSLRGAYDEFINNTVVGGEEGIRIYGRYSTVANNTVGGSVSGILVVSAMYNVIANNSVSGNHRGIDLNYHAIYNTIESNYVAGNDRGVYISDYAEYNTVRFNTVFANLDGIYINRAYHNTVHNNTIYGNSNTGLYCEVNSFENQIYLNTFFNNYDGNAYDSGVGNSWNCSLRGNHWSDYSGVGVYNIPGGAEAIDYHPIPEPETIPPEIDHPDDIWIYERTIENRITWSPTDDHPSRYVIYKNGTEIMSSSWIGNNISLSIDNLTHGVYNFTIVVYDFFDNWISDEVIVTVYRTISYTTTTTTFPTSPETTPTIPPTPLILVIILIGEIGVCIVLVILLYRKQ